MTLLPPTTVVVTPLAGGPAVVVDIAGVPAAVPGSVPGAPPAPDVGVLAGGSSPS